MQSLWSWDCLKFSNGIIAPLFVILSVKLTGTQVLRCGDMLIKLLNKAAVAAATTLKLMNIKLLGIMEKERWSLMMRILLSCLWLASGRGVAPGVLFCISLHFITYYFVSTDCIYSVIVFHIGHEFHSLCTNGSVCTVFQSKIFLKKQKKRKQKTTKKT